MFISINQLNQAKAWPDLIKAYQCANLEQFDWKDGFNRRIEVKDKFSRDYQDWLVRKFKLSGSFIQTNDNYRQFERGLLIKKQYRTVGGICTIKNKWAKYSDNIKKPFNKAYYPFYLAEHIQYNLNKINPHSIITIWNSKGQSVILKGDIDMPTKINKIKFYGI